MKRTKTLLDADAREAIHKGVNAIYEPVRRTLGPQAKTALLYRTYGRGSRITDDGVTVAEVQEPKNPFVNQAANTFKEMCKRTVEKVGDGTTTTCVIGGKLHNDVYELQQGTSLMTARGIGAATLRKNILESAEKVKVEVLKRSTAVSTLEEIERVATISVKDPELGKIVAKMAFEVGTDGYIDVVEGYKGEIETEVVKGTRFAAKVAAKAFVNNPKRFEMIAKDCPVLLTNHSLDSAGSLGKVLSKFNTDGVTKIVVIASAFSENVLVNMVNAVKAGYFIYPVAVPALRTDQFEDLAVYFGARFFDKAKGHIVENAKQSDLGFVEKLIVKDSEQREDAVATGGAGTRAIMGEGDNLVTTPIQQRIETLKEQLKEQKDDKFRKLLERRIAAVASAVGVIRVGYSTQATALYRKLKIEDCVYACKAALRGGYVKGGGLCLKEIAEEVLEETDILRAALTHPYELIQASLGGTPEEPVEIGEDVIDPTEAIYWAVEHATGVVAQLVTVEVITVEVEDQAPGDGYMAIASMIGEYVISNKIQLGQLRENQAEAERDRLGGLTEGEKVMLDNG